MITCVFYLLHVFSSGGNKESNTQSYSIHPVNIDMKVKVEPGVASYNQSTQVKTDSGTFISIVANW